MTSAEIRGNMPGMIRNLDPGRICTCRIKSKSIYACSESSSYNAQEILNPSLNEEWGHVVG